jgi:hypothetical protein
VAPNPPAFAACGASYTPAADLVDGPHKISVRSRDANGNFSPVVTWAFQVDTVGPDLHLDATPALLTNNPDATFQFSVLNETPDTVITFECQIDPPPLFAPCTSPVTYPGLADNRHTFQVRATDPAGNVTTVPYTWTVDTSKPQTQIGSRPRPVTNATTATFDYQSPNASPATFQCRIDGTAYTDCTQQPKVYANLLPGQHTFEVKAINSAGNEDPDPASYVWSIDTADPDTTLGAAPPAVTTSGFATFTFASEAGASFECRLDGSAWTACPTPKIYGELALGQHTFAVRAVDEAGNRDNSPATRTWTVVPAPTPPATAASGPNLINPFPVIRIAGTITKRGVRLRLFLVNAPAGSKVSTRCRGKGCPFSKKSRAARALRLRTVEKKFYPAGVRIEVFVTKPGMIGKYTRFKVRKGKAPVRTDRCLPPGSLKPVRCS